MVDAQKRAEIMLQLRMAERGLGGRVWRDTGLDVERGAGSGHGEGAGDGQAEETEGAGSARRRYGWGRLRARRRRAHFRQSRHSHGHGHGRRHAASARDHERETAGGGASQVRFAAGSAHRGVSSETKLDLSVAGMDMDGGEGDEPLQAQILSQKRLATYYGEVHIGGQPFKGRWLGERPASPPLCARRSALHPPASPFPPLPTRSAL